MKAAGILIFAAVLGGALLSAHQHKPFEMLIDATPNAGPATWPTNAAASPAQLNALPQMLVTPCPLTPQNLPTQPDRKA